MGGNWLIFRTATPPRSLTRRPCRPSSKSSASKRPIISWNEAVSPDSSRRLTMDTSSRTTHGNARVTTRPTGRMFASMIPPGRPPQKFLPRWKKWNRSSAKLLESTRKRSGFGRKIIRSRPHSTSTVDYDYAMVSSLKLFLRRIGVQFLIIWFFLGIRK